MYLEKTFSGISCLQRPDSAENMTGHFDVYVGDKLVHSKLNGDGWLDTPKKLKSIAAAVLSATTMTKSNGATGSSSTTTAAAAAAAVAIEVRNPVGNDEEDDEEGSNASLIVSLLTLMLSIPALIGA